MDVVFAVPMIRPLTITTLGLILVAGVAEAKPPAAARAYRTLPGVKLSADVERRMARLARHYKKAPGRQLVITSGTRTPAEQAAAMYRKLRRGRNLLRLYRRTGLAREVIRAYRKARRKRLGWRAPQKAMARVLQAQLDRGEHLSLHLRAGAVDVRSRNLTRRQKRIFRRLVRKDREIEFVKEERYPPHFHLEVYTPDIPRS